MEWLAHNDPAIGWANRSITVLKGGVQRTIKPIECLGGDAPRLAALTTKGLRRALRCHDVEELFLVRLEEADASGAPKQPKEHPAVAKLLRDYAAVFGELPHASEFPDRGIVHRIELKPGARPPVAPPLRHQSAKDSAFMKEHVEAAVACGQLTPSSSPFGSLALIVKKKDGTPRVVIDYRALNELTVKDKYPLPLMDELFDRVHGAKFFTKLDLRSGFHQIRLALEDREKTAFRTRFGSYEYTVLPMGLCNAPGTFMRLMNDTFRDLLDKCVLVFLDDILIFSRTEEEHVAAVKEVLERLRKNKLYAKLSKCEFFRQDVEFLGHRIGTAGLSVSQDKVQAVRDWPQPRHVKDLQSFLGLAGFYRRFVEHYSNLALPLTELTRKDAPFVWGTRQQAAFDSLKAALCSAPVLLIPDPAKPFTLNCDACNYAVGATLQQDHGRGLQPVAYRSRKLTPAEINYDTREKEFLALVDACSHWRHYLHSELPFTLLSDHDSLKYHKKMPHLSGRLARWLEKMAEFDYMIAHIPGVKNVVADALSRRADYARDADANDRLAAAELDEHRMRAKAAAELTLPPAPDRPAPQATTGAIVMPSHFCTAHTKAGSLCRQRTAKGQYCWNHLRSIRGLRIKRSSVPRAGFGLFADRDLPAGYKVDYTGDLAPLASDADGGAYFLQLTKHSAIDAARTDSGEGRWVNDPRGADKEANTEFVLYTPPGKPRQACVRTLRPIEKGEEILVKYGAAYWRFTRPGPKCKKLLRRRIHGRREEVALLAPLVTTVTSSLTDDMRAAGQADAAYSERLLALPAGFTALNGLLWRDAVLIVPNDVGVRTRLLAEHHDATTGAHFGRDKMLSAMRDRFDWDGMATAVSDYVRTCDACQRNKPSQQATPGLLMPLPIPDRPCQEWTTDAVTGLPRTARGNDAIQVYVDRLTKVKHFVASSKSATARDLAASFVHAVVRPHGVPESIVSDRDPRFTGHFYAALTEALGVDLKMSTARHPQTDGQSEREIRTLITALRAYCNERRDDWDECLDALELGFNCSVQASTGRTPFEMLYGSNPRLPVDIALDAIRVPAAVDRAEAIRRAVQFGRDHLLTAQQRQARNADRHRRDASFGVGDRVLLSTDGLELRDAGDKLCPRFIGPFNVTAIVNPNAYTLALPPRLKALHPTFNISKLKPYHDGSSAFPSRPQQHPRPPPEARADSNGDAEWEVERILKSKNVGRGKRYLVAWKGYPPEENTWERRANLLPNAAQALADFESGQASVD